MNLGLAQLGFVRLGESLQDGIHLEQLFEDHDVSPWVEENPKDSVARKQKKWLSRSKPKAVAL